MLRAGTQRIKRVLRRLGCWVRRKSPRFHHDLSASLNQSRRLEGRFCGNPFKQFDVYDRSMPPGPKPTRSHGAAGTGRPCSTTSETEFAVRSIWRTDHPEFPDFLAVLRDPRLADPIVDLGNISEYRRRALETQQPPLSATA